MYAFKNIRNGKYLAGTDFNTFPRRQILVKDDFATPKLFTEYDVKHEMKRRGINPKTYKIVKVKLVEEGVEKDGSR